MSIVKMKRLRLLALREDRDSILRLLQKHGCVEISEPDADPGLPEWDLLAKSDPGGQGKTGQQSSLLTGACRILEAYTDTKAGLFLVRPVLSESELFDEGGYTAALGAAQTVLDTQRSIAAMTAERSRLLSHKAALAPWLPLDAPFHFEGGGKVTSVFATVPSKTDRAAMEAAVSSVSETGALFYSCADRKLRYFLLVCHTEEEAACLEAMRPFGFARADTHGWTGTAAEHDRLLDAQLAALDRKLEQAEQQLDRLASVLDDLRRGIDRSAQDAALQECADRLLATDRAFFLRGWIPARSERLLADILRGFPCAWETQDPTPDEYADVPVLLKNNPLTAPYSVLTRMYSLPAYNSVDPNPFLMPFFSLFFGIMFADMAYGLIMFLAGLLGQKLLKPRATAKNMMSLLMQCGISAFLTGFLTGSFFGDAVSVVGRLFGKEWSLVPYLGTVRIGDAIAIDLPLNLLEGSNPLYVLLLAMLLGVIHLAFGVGIATYLNIKEKNIPAAAADLSWWCIFAGLAVLAANGSTAVLLAGIAVLVLSTILQGRGWGRVTGVFGAVYNGLTGYLGDILSYSRLMALMLAGSVIAGVFNQLGALGGLALFIPVAFIGHLLNFALNLIGCFVHAMRLQFLEFFGKWYREGGRPFQPLRYNTKYVDIKEESQ